MGLTRRRFIQLLVSGAAAAGLGAGAKAIEAVAAPSETASADKILAFVANGDTTGHLVHTTAVSIPPRAPARNAPASNLLAATGQRWVMVIDLAKCNGCGDCTAACDKYHFVPPGQEWIKVYRNTDAQGENAYWFPRPCMQCDNPPCTKVCPVSATYKRSDGIVIMDQDRCIGCRYCIAACPYQARYFNWGEPPHIQAEHAAQYSIEMNYPHRRGVVEKCIFCPQEGRNGRIPACAAACPMGAIWYGDQNEDAVTNSQGQTVKLAELIQKNGGYRFLEELGTEPRVWYLPAKGRRYPAPPASGNSSHG